jgi:N-acetylneuraminate synthase
VGNKRLLESAARKASEIIISSGMSSWDELDAAFNHTYSINSNISLLHCVSKYPCPLELVGLENLKLIKERYACKTGLSDHSGKLAPALCAVSSGIADLVEVHVTYNRMCFGPDSTSSLELNELKLLVELVKDIDIITNSSTSKDDIAHQLADVKKIFGRSIFSARALPKGSVLELSDLNFKKPGYFLGPENIDLVIGKTLVCDIDFDQPILEYHLS